MKRNEIIVLSTNQYRLFKVQAGSTKPAYEFKFNASGLAAASREASRIIGANGLIGRHYLENLDSDNEILAV